jgi:Na+-transporting methylmalonyl-CoA/oxaloacetate decarboxylase gamma subunit
MGYLDPGIFGMISQIAYVLVFAVVSGLMFFFQPIKHMFDRLFKRSVPESTTVETAHARDSQQPGV